ncbi:hypothetical protein RC74_16135 [Falsihalocynthiibacter arcticus]|uniref:Uncharacterized protein n=1 Tax=Falsihalocynthiibacter arcticus TaxID=1579316 RepID=A0A126V2Q0_9RHOB|nr:hypothetical protein RC74_16135 [Falsihalocynthiibacter arcticus]
MVSRENDENVVNPPKKTVMNKTRTSAEFAKVRETASTARSIKRDPITFTAIVRHNEWVKVPTLHINANKNN